MRGMKRLRRPRRGVAVVEFALCVPILLVVIFAIIEFSRAMQIQQTVRQAAFEGARAGLALDAAASDATTAATSIATAAGLNSPTVTVSPNPLSYTSQTVQVTVSVSPTNNSWFMRYVLGSQQIGATITLDREVQAVSNP